MNNHLNNMSSRKIFLLAPVLLLCVVFFSGCGTNATGSQQSSDLEKDKSDAQEEPNQNVFGALPDNAETLDISSLEVGWLVLVMGTKNDDGSVSANRIITGDNLENLPFWGGTASSSPNGAPPSLSRDRQIPEGQTNGNMEERRAEFEKARDMSEEDRAKFREQMAEQRGEQTGEFRAGRGASAASLNGEVIKKDDSVLTLKLKDGGSALVFYSEQTELLKINPPQE